MPRSDPTIRTVTVETGGKDPESPSYSTTDALKCIDITLSLDEQPSSATFEWRVASDRQEGPGYTVDDLIRSTDSYDGWGIGPWEFEDHVRVSVDGTAVFIGQFVEYSIAYNDGGVVATLYAEDARAMLAKLPVFGRWVDGFNTNNGFIYGAYTVFNEDGKRTLQELSRDTSSQIPAFATPDAISTGAQFNSVYWRLIDVLRYLQKAYDKNNGEAHVALTGNWTQYVDWPGVTDGGDSPSAVESELSDEENVIQNLSLHGMSFADAITAVLSRGSELHWTLINESGDKPTLKIIGDFDGELNIAIDLGETGGKIQDEEATATRVLAESLDLSRSWKEFYNETWTHGGPRSYELTLSTLDNTLKKDWSDEEQEAYIEALSDPDDKRQSEDLYQDVFLKWRVADNIDWATYFDDNNTAETSSEWKRLDKGIAVRGSRKQRQYLHQAEAFRTYLNRGETSDQSAPRHQIVVQRSTDSGATWETIPASIKASPLGDVGGIMLSDNARLPSRKGQTGQIDAWTWNFTDTSDVTVYDIRITCVFDHDANIWARSPSTGRDLANKNIKRKAIRADAKNVYESITYAATRKWSGGVQSIDENTLSAGKGAHSVQKENTDQLVSTSIKMGNQLAKLPTSGSCTIQGCDPEHRKSIGSKVTAIFGNPDGIDVTLGITEIRMTFDPDQTTTFIFGLT